MTLEPAPPRSHPVARFPGVIPAVTTPFTATGEVDHAALADSVEWLLDAGVHGFVAAGTMGEAGSLTGEERGAVVRTVVERPPAACPSGRDLGGDAAQSAAYARDAQAAAVDGLMCLPPLGYRGDAAEITAYFADVAAATDLPIMLYNNPEASGVDLPCG
jgi:4-hydroxy-tetrahydrodipicolinate synthase